MLGAVEDALRNTPASNTAQEHFGFEAPELEVGRAGCRELHKGVIQEGNSQLEGRGHAHPVVFGEVVVRQESSISKSSRNSEKLSLDAAFTKKYIRLFIFSS